MGKIYRSIKNIAKKSPTLQIPSVTKMSLEGVLNDAFCGIKPGTTLDLGAGDCPYKHKVPHTEYFSLDIRRDCNPNIISDAHSLPFGNSTFDTVISTEVLEHIKNPEIMISEMLRILRPCGICIVSSPFLYPLHPRMNGYFLGDFHRFTLDEYKHLFREFSQLETFSHGNRILVMWETICIGKQSILFNLLNPIVGAIRYKDERFHLGYVVKAKK